MATSSEEYVDYHELLTEWRDEFSTWNFTIDEEKVMKTPDKVLTIFPILQRFNQFYSDLLVEKAGLPVESVKVKFELGKGVLVEKASYDKLVAKFTIFYKRLNEAKQAFDADMKKRQKGLEKTWKATCTMIDKEVEEYRKSKFAGTKCPGCSQPVKISYGSFGYCLHCKWCETILRCDPSEKK